MHDNGTIVRDYIPCQTTAGEIGLWDDVNSVFYGNAGTGTFTAGPVIAIAADESKITKLEYIESSGTQYVDTGFTANQNTSATIKFSTTQQSGGGILVAMQGWKNRGFGIFVNAIIFGSSTADRNGMFGNGNIHEVTLTSGAKCYDNGSLIWSGSVSTFTTPATLTICKSNDVSGPHEFSSAKIYSCQIYDNGTLVREYISAKLADGTVGLYDKLNGLLYINAGTGTFIAGPVKEPPDAPANLHHLLAVRLAWSAVNGATKYNVYRDDVLLASTTETTYIDMTAAENTEYVYAVSAVNSAGESPKTTITVYTKSGYFLYKPYVESATFQ